MKVRWQFFPNEATATLHTDRLLPDAAMEDGEFRRGGYRRPNEWGLDEQAARMARRLAEVPGMVEFDTRSSDGPHAIYVVKGFAHEWYPFQKAVEEVVLGSVGDDTIEHGPDIRPRPEPIDLDALAASLASLHRKIDDLRDELAAAIRVDG